jgi:S1-C subfamily serine protease
MQPNKTGRGIVSGTARFAVKWEDKTLPFFRFHLSSGRACRAVAILVAVARPAGAEPADAAMPAVVGVQIEKPAGDSVHYSQGSGIFLGDGLVLTAAHVISPNPQLLTVSIVMDGWRTDARLLATAPAGLDVALLKITSEALSLKRRQLAPTPLCATGTGPDQPVVVAAQGTVSLSRTVGAPIRSTTLNGDWRTILATGYTHGASGGGVFDAQKGCLAGILIIAASGQGMELTEFLPAAKIAAFLAPFQGR